jgi:hypothetical protein
MFLPMSLRCRKRKKDGKTYRDRSVVERRRTKRGKIVQRHVLYRGEINDSRHAARCKSIEVVHTSSNPAKPMAIFPEDRQAPELDCAVVQKCAGSAAPDAAPAVGRVLTDPGVVGRARARCVLSAAAARQPQGY